MTHRHPSSVPDAPDVCGPADAASSAPSASGAALSGLWVRATPADRLLGGAIALLAWGVLIVAVTLTPDPAGHGTHEQLGIPPCATLTTTGYPCPSCGMTTAFAAFVHGELLTALRAQILGALLAAATLLVGLGSSLTAVSGISFSPLLSRLFVGRTWWIWALSLLALVSWAIKAFVWR